MQLRGEVVRLEPGGHISCDSYGDPAGTPVFFCHGWPSSRSMAQLTDAAARKLGLHIISPDRPGIRGSSFAAERTLAQWPEVMRAVLRHFGIETVHVLAISGGAPYAYISGWQMPELVRGIAVVSGAPPIAELTDQRGLWRLHRWMLALHGSHPKLMRKLFRVARPIACMRMSLRYRMFLRLLLQRTDAEALHDRAAFESCFESSRLAWQASLEGVIADAEIYARPWGFPLEEVHTPVSIWHGTKDRTFSYKLAEDVARRLPHCELHLVEDAGHYSLPIRYTQQILADLMAH